MAIIHELDKTTIDQIAAGEVVERPSSVVKELVENAIDSGATSVTVEIKDGGTTLIRVTDNGSGIEKDQIRKAFKRHATSKITKFEDLFAVSSLGFRGEALSSISSVAKVEMITKTEEELSGIRYEIQGGEEVYFEEVGAPNGTTFIIRDIFYNTPARKKFLKTPQTEGSYIADVMEHMAMDNPSISFHFINNKDDKFITSGNGDLKELIYRIYGRDIAYSLVPISASENGITMEGYLGQPSVNRSNRNFEIFFINGRYVKDKVVSKAIEEGYKQYLMMHKFPFVVLHFTFEPGMVDVNVHPAKMEVRFNNQPALYDFVRRNIEETLRAHEMIPDALLDEAEDKKEKAKELLAKEEAAKAELEEKKKTVVSEEWFSDEKDNTVVNEEKSKIQESVVSKSKEVSYEKAPEPFETSRLVDGKLEEATPVYAEGIKAEPVKIEDNTKSAVWTRVFGNKEVKADTAASNYEGNIIKAKDAVIVEKGMQLNLFDEKILTKDNRQDYEILGQIFGTYWLFGFKDKLFIVDQHAAHEKVNYERMIKKYKEKSITSQLINPPVIVTLSAQEEDIFLEYRAYFEKLGFNIENFGGKEYAIREMPTDLYGCAGEKEMFIEILDDLSHEGGSEKTPDVINYKIASMACKASVKGNTRMTREEMSELLDELLTLENPYNCPHGRPTIISMSKYEIDKKFKRVVN
ncbi:MAG: DNA mismatch repair endonuclease MutL [Butyrivibrio sp.]|nr:DNA mismatch repair endonuclease MutL [Butyrivibrio sp.]